MIPFHSVLHEIAQREVRCLHIGEVSGAGPTRSLGVGEYAFVEYYCDDLDCDCRRVLIQVIARHCPDEVLSSISYGWEKESFYRKRTPWNPDDAIGTVRGELDPKQAIGARRGVVVFVPKACVGRAISAAPAAALSVVPG